MIFLRESNRNQTKFDEKMIYFDCAGRFSDVFELIAKIDETVLSDELEEENQWRGDLRLGSLHVELMNESSRMNSLNPREERPRIRCPLIDRLDWVESVRLDVFVQMLC